jgi:hypothetical protein
METKKKKKKKILLLILILLVLCISVVFLTPKGSNPITETISKIPGINKTIDSETIEMDGLDIDTERERLQMEVDENMLNARIASSLEPDSEGFVFLSLKNKYENKLLQVSVMDENSGDIYYTSPVLRPEDTIDYGKLLEIPSVGEYDCIAYFYYYTLDEEPISLVGAKVNLSVKEGE